MRSSEISDLKQERQIQTVLGTLSILTKENGLQRHENVLLIENNRKGAKYPFRAIRPLTKEEVPLNAASIYDAYIALDRPLPEKLK